MSEAAVVVENNLPPFLVVDVLARPGLHVIAHNLQLAGGLLAQEVSQQPSDDRRHPAAQHDNGDVVCPRVRMELLESGVQLNVLQQQVDTLVVRRAYAVHHVLETVPEVTAAEEHVLVPLLAKIGAEADVVGHEVIAVLQSDCAVEICEKDVLGAGLQRRQIGHRAHDVGLMVGAVASNEKLMNMRSL